MVSSFDRETPLALRNDPGHQEQLLPMNRFLADYPLCPASAMGRYWQSCVPEDGTLPDRSCFQPSHCPQVLPYLTVFDVERTAENGVRFRYRLMGEAMTLFYGGNVVGKTLQDVLPEPFLSQRQKVLEACVANKGPTFGIRDFTSPQGTAVRTAFGFFPYVQSDTELQLFLVASPDDVIVRG